MSSYGFEVLQTVTLNVIKQIVEMKEVAAGSTATTSNTNNSGSACCVALSFHLAGARRCTPEECEDEVRLTSKQSKF